MAKESKRQRATRATAGMEPRDRFIHQAGVVASLVNKFVTKAHAFGKAANGDDKIAAHFSAAVEEIAKAQDFIGKLDKNFQPAGGYQRRVIAAGDLVTVKDDYSAVYAGITKPGDKLTVQTVAGTER